MVTYQIPDDAAIMAFAPAQDARPEVLDEILHPATLISTVDLLARRDMPQNHFIGI